MSPMVIPKLPLLMILHPSLRSDLQSLLYFTLYRFHPHHHFPPLT
jgi:hypothetical protein